MEQPRQFGGFLLFRESESNAYRTSYRAGVARGRAIDRVVHLEVFDGPEIDGSRLLEQFEASSGLQDRIRDPYIARGIGLGEAGSVPYAAYDFELGVTLATFIEAAREKQFPVPFDQALFITERIALALAAAHQIEHNGGPLLHSFLTPDSVLLSNEGGVKVLGFETGAGLRDQLAQGSRYARYLAPECRSGGDAGPEDDVFSLGSILYELVTGHPLGMDGFAVGEPGKLGELIVHATGEPASTSLVRLLEGSFAAQPERIPNVLEWQQALGRLILNGEYNPTTFNLAFLMHTILRDRLEQDDREFKREKQFLLSREIESELAAEKSSSHPTPVATASPLPTPARSPVDEADSAPSGSAAAVEPNGESDEVGRKPFWLGFALSAIAGGLVLGTLMLVGSKESKDPLTPSPLDATVSRGTEPAAAAAPAGPPPIPFETAAEADPQPTDSDDFAQTDIVNGELGESPPLDEQEIERRVRERALEIERDLEADYQKKLASLRAQAEEEATRPADGEVSTPSGLAPAASQPAAIAGKRTPAVSKSPRPDDAGGRQAVPAASGETSPEPGVAVDGPSGPSAGRTDSDPLGSDLASSPSPPASQGPDQSAAGSMSNSGTGEAPTGSPPDRSASSPAGSPAEPSAGSPAEPSAGSPAEPSAGSPAEPSAGSPAGPSAGQKVPLSPSTAPRLLRLGSQTYPPVASRLGLSARVRVKVLIGSKGKVVEAEVIGEKVGNGFDAAALATVRKSRWAPATTAGEPVEAWTTVTIAFEP